MVMASAQEINLSKLSLDEKLGQMVMVSGNTLDEQYSALHVGGIFIDKHMTKEEVQELIKSYQNSSSIKLLVAADLEGYWNPFPFFYSKQLGEIATDVDAYEVGASHGKILKELGFTIDFSPVVEVRNQVWPGRSFTGSKEEIHAKVSQYISGVQSKDVLATAKHYPGGSMLRDPHKFIVHALITNDDLEYFDDAISHGVKAVMVGHPVVSGALDSHGKQASLSPDIITALRQHFQGLIITDSIGMLGLRLSYLFHGGKLYVDLVKAGNDLILDTGMFASPHSASRGIAALKQAVQLGEISEQNIDASVRRILTAKGYTVR